MERSWPTSWLIMRMSLFLFYFRCRIHTVEGFSVHGGLEARTIAFPLIEQSNGLPTDTQLIRHKFDYIVHCSEYFDFRKEVSTVATDKDESILVSFGVPRLCDNVVVDFRLHNRNVGDEDCNASFLLTVSGATIQEFGWICTKLYQKRDLFEGQLESKELRKEVVDHLNREPPCPGFLSSSSADGPVEHDSQQAFLDGLITPLHIQQLQEQGYVVLEPTALENKQDSFHIEEGSQDRLTQYLVEQTGDAFRRDRVHFLTKPQACEAGIGAHYNMLLSIATFLNDRVNFRKSKHNPIAPATVQDPLTVPRMIQLAEYSLGDYYVSHSDNALESKANDESGATGRTFFRNNFRHFTCILYCNDLEEDDGGALRIYLESRDKSNQAAEDTCSYVDIIPKNGRLLIFDSCLVHSVRKVTSLTKIRRALTLWILRPNDGEVLGETYF